MARKRPSPKTKAPPQQPAEAPSAPSPKTDPTNPEKETMEVHHHPQLDHKPKPWKEYLLEGMMIFLAVFMGFIAENIRENISNNDHVHILAGQLVKDLKTDTAQLDSVIISTALTIQKNDTLFKLLQQPLATADTKKIQNLIGDSYRIHPFHPSLGTITAIKNQLQLKQFEESEIAKYMADYEAENEAISKSVDIEVSILQKDLEPFFKAHFTPANIYNYMKNGTVLDSRMRNITQNDLDGLSVDIVMAKTLNESSLGHLEKAREKAVRMIQYVDRQFEPKDE